MRLFSRFHPHILLKRVAKATVKRLEQESRDRCVSFKKLGSLNFTNRYLSVKIRTESCGVLQPATTFEAKQNPSFFYQFPRKNFLFLGDNLQADYTVGGFGKVEGARFVG